MITDHVAPGRSADARLTDVELKQTTFVKVALDECSAKVSEGFPEEPDEDLALDVWAGILPLRTVAGEPILTRCSTSRTSIQATSPSTAPGT